MEVNYCCTTCDTLDFDESDQNISFAQSKEKLRAIISTDLIWPQKSTIKIGFLGDGDGINRNFDIIKEFPELIDPLQFAVTNLSVKDMIKTVVNERIQPLVNLTLMFVDDPSTADVRISFDKEKGCNSAVGIQALKIRNKNKGTMNFAWISVWGILHEFGHCLGMRHEHQSPSCNIQWDKNKVYDWGKKTLGWNKKKVDDNIINQLDGKDFTNSTFDPLSIMLYLFPPELTLNNLGVKQNYRLSGKDVIWITKTYPLKDTPEELKELCDKFYSEVYNIKLDDSVAESDSLAKNYTPAENCQVENSFNWKIPLIISIIVLLIFICYLAYNRFYKNKKHQYIGLKKL